MIKNLIVAIFLVYLTVAMQFSLGVYNPKQKTWRGYNPICDDQCSASNGIICGNNVRQCCASDQCINKSGFFICV